MKRSTDVAAVLKAAAHPVRLDVLRLLAARRVLSPAQLSAEIEGVTLPVVSYHVHVLAQAGLVHPAGTKRGRGAVAHFYRIADEGKAVIAAADVLRAAGREA